MCSSWGRHEGATLLRRSLILCLGATAIIAQASIQPAVAIQRHASSTKSWTSITAPLPMLPNGQVATSGTLLSTSCSSTSFCVAVGQASAGNDRYPLIETSTGASWTASVAPLPPAPSAGESSGLVSVSCGSDGACAAVGWYVNTDSQQAGLLETLSGGVWTATEASLPPSAVGVVNLWSVSCVAGTTSCLAVGDMFTTTFVPLMYSLTAGGWQLLTAPPMPSNSSSLGQLSAVSCPASGICVVVGTYYDQNNAPQGLILISSSDGWKAEQAPLPQSADEIAGQRFGVLQSVDCVSADSCIAGGAYSNKAGYGDDALLVSLASGAWTPLQAPVPPGTSPKISGADIQGISCVAVQQCVAAGTIYQDINGDESGMLLTQSATGWTAATAPVPITAGSRLLTAHRSIRNLIALSGISCTSSRSCRAVGRDGKHPLIERKRQ